MAAFLEETETVWLRKLVYGILGIRNCGGDSFAHIDSFRGLNYEIID